jgi:hypothetical protein
MKTENANTRTMSYQKLAFCAAIAAIFTLNCMTAEAKNYKVLADEQGEAIEVYSEPIPVFAGTSNWAVNLYQEFVAKIASQSKQRNYSRAAAAAEAHSASYDAPIQLRQLNAAEKGGNQYSKER